MSRTKIHENDDVHCLTGRLIDYFFRSCKNFFQCYECAKMEDPICKGDQVRYKYRLIQDTRTNKKLIECGKLTKWGRFSPAVCMQLN